MMSGECLTTDSWSRETMVGGAHICSDFDFHGVNTPIIADSKLPAWSHWPWIWGEMYTIAPQVSRCQLQPDTACTNQVSMSLQVKSSPGVRTLLFFMIGSWSGNLLYSNKDKCYLLWYHHSEYWIFDKCFLSKWTGTLRLTLKISATI